MEMENEMNELNNLLNENRLSLLNLVKLTNNKRKENKVNNKKLTEQEKIRVLYNYFTLNHTIKETADILNLSKSVVGRVVKEYKEIIINDRKDYLPYSKYYYKKKMARKSTNDTISSMNELISSIKKGINYHTGLLSSLKKTMNEAIFLLELEKLFKDEK